MANKNFALARQSKNEQKTINSNPYIDVARAYYNSTMYDDNRQVIPSIFSDTLPVFNAIPKVVNIAAALSIGGDIESCDKDDTFVKEIIKNLALEQEKSFMAKELILGKSILIEIENTELSGEETDSDFKYKMAYYSADEYEIISVGFDILYAKIEGTRFELNETGDNYVEKKVNKIFIRDNESGTAKSYIEVDGEKENEITYDGGVLPLVEINTTYDMTQLFYSVDRYNEFEALIRQLLYLAGEPILAGMGLDKVQPKATEAMKEDRFKKQKMLFTKSETSKLALLEIQGSSARVMIEKQHAIIENIIKDYPEYSISEVLSGSNISEETTRIRMTEVLSRVSELRKNIELGLNRLIAVISFLDGKDMGDRYITLGNMVDINLKDMLETLRVALDYNLISKESAMFQIKTLFNGENVDKELSIIEKENKEAQKNMIDMQKNMTNGDNSKNTIGQGDDING